MFSDQISSTSLTRDDAGTNKVQRYTPWGETRTDGGLETDHTYTGQIEDTTTGLKFYNARYMDPVLARFVSPDTIVPNPSNGQNYNRYSYVENNPLRYSDPTGHDVCADGAGGCGGVRHIAAGLDANGDGIICSGGLGGGCESSWQRGSNAVAADREAAVAPSSSKPIWHTPLDEELLFNALMNNYGSFRLAAGDDDSLTLLLMIIFAQEGGYWRHGVADAVTQIPVVGRDSFGPMSLRNDPRDFGDFSDGDFLIASETLLGSLYLAVMKLEARSEYITGHTEQERQRQYFLAYSIGDETNLRALQSVNWDLDAAVSAGALPTTVAILQSRDANYNFWTG